MFKIKKFIPNRYALLYQDSVLIQKIDITNGKLISKKYALSQLLKRNFFKLHKNIHILDIDANVAFDSDKEFSDHFVFAKKWGFYSKTHASSMRITPGELAQHLMRESPSQLKCSAYAVCCGYWLNELMLSTKMHASLMPHMAFFWDSPFGLYHWIFEEKNLIFFHVWSREKLKKEQEKIHADLLAIQRHLKRTYGIDKVYIISSHLNWPQGFCLIHLDNFLTTCAANLKARYNLTNALMQYAALNNHQSPCDDLMHHAFLGSMTHQIASLGYMKTNIRLSKTSKFCTFKIKMNDKKIRYASYAMCVTWSAYCAFSIYDAHLNFRHMENSINDLQMHQKYLSLKHANFYQKNKDIQFFLQFHAQLADKNMKFWTFIQNLHYTLGKYARLINLHIHASGTHLELYHAPKRQNMRTSNDLMQKLTPRFAQYLGERHIKILASPHSGKILESFEGRLKDPLSIQRTWIIECASPISS